MHEQWIAGDSVKETYDAFALVREEFNRGCMHESWTGRLLFATRPSISAA